MFNTIRNFGLAIVLGLLVLLGVAGVTEVDPGEYTILIKQIGDDKGMQAEGLATGTHWVNPVIYDTETYNTRIEQIALEDISAGTKDGQPILVDVSFDKGLVDAKVPALHEAIGKSYLEQVFLPAARSAIRAATSSVTSDEIYTGKGRLHVQNAINDLLIKRMDEHGIIVTANLRDIDFQNKDFVKLLEDKAKAGQREEIERRLALAAIETAKRVENEATGAKNARIQAAIAVREEKRLEGEGERLKQEEIAKGILAVGLAEAEVTAEKRAALAGPGGKEMVQIEWARNLGPNVRVYGFPTGSPGTSSIMDLNGIFKGALQGSTPPSK